MKSQQVKRGSVFRGRQVEEDFREGFPINFL